MRLKYPEDRYDGYVILEFDGKPYVPRLTRCDEYMQEYRNIKKHCVAWRILLKRWYGKDFEPCAVSESGM